MPLVLVPVDEPSDRMRHRLSRRTTLTQGRRHIPGGADVASIGVVAGTQPVIDAARQIWTLDRNVTVEQGQEVASDLGPVLRVRDLPGHGVLRRVERRREGLLVASEQAAHDEQPAAVLPASAGWRR